MSRFILIQSVWRWQSKSNKIKSPTAQANDTNHFIKKKPLYFGLLLIKVVFWKCDIQLVSFSFAVEKPFPRYVSVNVTSNTFTTAIYSLLLYFTGFHWSPQSEKCASSEVGSVHKFSLYFHLFIVCPTITHNWWMKSKWCGMANHSNRINHTGILSNIGQGSFLVRAICENILFLMPFSGTVIILD